MVKRLLLTLMIFVNVTCVFLVRIHRYASVVNQTNALELTPVDVETNTGPIPVYLSQSEPVPDQVKITNIEIGGEYGTGYLVQTEDGVMVVTATHVVQADYLVIESDDFAIYSKIVPVCEVKRYADVIVDGVCLISQSERDTANIVRDVSQIPEEISVYNRDLNIWMAFRVTGVGLGLFSAEGLEMDTDGDGVADFTSHVCRGMSGSPAVESSGGVPILNDESLMISRGEVAYISDTYEDEGVCSEFIWILNLEI